jgi:hypothetical protein
LEGTGIVAVGKHLEPVEPQHFESDCVREGPSRPERWMAQGWGEM